MQKQGSVQSMSVNTIHNWNVLKCIVYYTVYYDIHFLQYFNRRNQVRWCWQAKFYNIYSFKANRKNPKIESTCSKNNT